MDERQTETALLNPYARTFFWVWGLALVALASYQARVSEHHAPLNDQSTQRTESVTNETGWLLRNQPHLSLKHTACQRRSTYFFP